MATLATQLVTRAGTAPTYAAATVSGDRFTPGPSTWLHVKNTNGSSMVVTVVTPRTDALGNAVADNTVTVPATTGERVIGPFPAEFYGSTTDGLADITYSAVTGVTIGAFSTV